MKIVVKRVYDAPEKSDGSRILIDRLWPRGVKKEDAAIDIWAKDLAPSNTLRSWFHKDPEKRYAEFAKKYRAELSKKKVETQELFGKAKIITLVTAVKDIERSHVPTLFSFFKKK